MLALLILLDQVPRNVFRGSAHSYATDSLARHYAARGVEAGFDRQVDRAMRIFFYCRSRIPKTSPTRNARWSCTARSPAAARTRGRHATTR